MRVPGPVGAEAFQLLPKISPTMEVALEEMADLEAGGAAAADGCWVHEGLFGVQEEEEEEEKKEWVGFWRGCF